MVIVEKKQQGALSPVDLRKKLGLTQKQVAELLGIREATLSNWETGKVPHIPPSKIKRMMEVYQCDIDILIDAFEGNRVVSR
ncbi:MAG: XRE family transcriptional regulator [Oscillatoriales cyanobacterium]|uniref:helix-turn-helix domain-containing protein n=1 Tax=unclassified Microcoleus TaxID=2642155 RepID=UPI001DEAA547|nr:helix-turn-helix transcriptional regulator [Microcoleus sp. PH2017_12_PCY_D_A]MCC3459770.1 helix-turn-helix transcriptional regulator [Microcoleus sp. PH2017_11_PCY_U_A]TAF00889.1 MAG: XRE family transcriptional regulator [Oscillatoriales cyanobacterium]MCC3478203.1 helix-turn-helix transcriptional regulator [Microcoleus sp. PH2017_12_PCY_D_A]TAF21353.1 MAG: XRE family transcriptional regulator [Oscillatoriales cyanobacterium]TAF39720.1 MAG: XRE family transcriptional regulator [Oscillatori